MTDADSPPLASVALGRDSALSGIKEIETEQAKKKEMADMMNLAREYKQVGIHANTKGIPDGMSNDLKNFLRNNGISIPGGKDIEGMVGL